MRWAPHVSGIAQYLSSCDISGTFQRVAPWGQRVCVRSPSLDTVQRLSTVTVPVTPRQHPGALGLPRLPAIGVVFHFNHFARYVVWWHYFVALLRISLMINKVEQLFMCVLASWSRASSDLLLIYWLGYLTFYLLMSVNYSYVLDMKPLSRIHIVNVFSYPVGCLFTLLMVPSDKWKFLYWDRKQARLHRQREQKGSLWSPLMSAWVPTRVKISCSHQSSRIHWVPCVRHCEI